ncbi:MAG: flagellar hook-associated protein FlgK [Pseudomonadota bacterium]
MGSNILGIGQSALAAAQIGLSTAGHNIANASTPGYSRQIVVQSAARAQYQGFGYVGQGTQVATIQRSYSDYLGKQVLTSQTAKSEIDSYYSQIKQIDNLLADPVAGLSPALQDFFKGIQDLAANPADTASRQSVLSTAQALAGRFQSLDGRISELRDSVNSQITTSLGTVNSYATQIAKLNDSIEKALAASDGTAPPNDLMDQRDQLVTEMGKEVKVSVVKENNSYNIFFGSGQPLVIGTQTFKLNPTISPTDPARTEVAYVSNGATILLSESTFTGGKLGGLFAFRAQSLDEAQNSLGRVAVGFAATFNAQHQLGQDLAGVMGGQFFTAAPPLVTSNSNNAGTAVMGASISNVSALTTSNYRLQVVTAAVPPAPAVPVTPGSYRVTRLSDGNVSNFSTFPQTVDGVDFNVASGTIANGDDFLIRPTVNGASGLNVVITDPTKIAAAAPIRTGTVATNTGSGKITAESVDASYTAATVTPALSLSYNSTTNQLSGFPATLPVTVTNNGTPVAGSPFAAGAPVTYTAGATISFGGVSFVMSGTPGNADTFNVGANTSGVGDSRNALLLGNLQTSNTLANGTANYQGAYAQMVSLIGNKTHELEVTGNAEGKLLAEAVKAQQSTSGVNLDEEATNLLRYQQAYQAAGKVMSIASTLFDVILSIGN